MAGVEVPVDDVVAYSREFEDVHSFKKLPLKRFPKVDTRDNSELRFWGKYKFPITVKEYNAVSSIHFSPSSPYDYAVTSGSRVQVYSNHSNKVKKTLSRFKQMAYSGCFRHDGKLIAAGSEEGVVKVFDSSSRAVLRQFKGHTKPVKTVKFTCDGKHVMSGSEDTTVKCWDLSTQSCLLTLRGHEDYVRCVVTNPVQPDLLLSCSYDHTVRLWDTRRPTSEVLQVSHDAPVEGALIFPSGSMCVTCGGQYVRVWDLLAGGRSLVGLSNHQKTITCVCFDSSQHRLLSASLDKQVKVYSVQDYRVLHSMSYPAPVLSIAIAHSDTHLVVGMSTKLLSIKHCVTKEITSVATPTSIPIRGGSYRYFVRGKTYTPSSDEYVVAGPKKLRLKPYEHFLKKFKYKKALQAVFQEDSGHGLVVYSLLQELARREGLQVALAGLNEEELEPLLRYLGHHLSRPQCACFLLDVAHIVADIYGGMLSESTKTRVLFALLKVKVDRELEFQKQAFQLLGCLDTLLTSSTAHQTHS